MPPTHEPAPDTRTRLHDAKEADIQRFCSLNHHPTNEKTPPPGRLQRLAHLLNRLQIAICDPSFEWLESLCGGDCPYLHTQITNRAWVVQESPPTLHIVATWTNQPGNTLNQEARELGLTRELIY